MVWRLWWVFFSCVNSNDLIEHCLILSLFSFCFLQLVFSKVERLSTNSALQIIVSQNELYNIFSNIWNENLLAWVSDTIFILPTFLKLHWQSIHDPIFIFMFVHSILKILNFILLFLIIKTFQKTCLFQLKTFKRSVCLSFLSPASGSWSCLTWWSYNLVESWNV